MSLRPIGYTILSIFFLWRSELTCRDQQIHACMDMVSSRFYFERTNSYNAQLFMFGVTSPTEHVTLLEPVNPSIDNFCGVQKRLAQRLHAEWDLSNSLIIQKLTINRLHFKGYALKVRQYKDAYCNSDVPNRIFFFLSKNAFSNFLCVCMEQAETSMFMQKFGLGSVHKMYPHKNIDFESLLVRKIHF